jgi:hypothetical protein
MARFSAAGYGLKALLLLLISVMAFSIRLFSVVKYESVIHEVPGGLGGTLGACAPEHYSTRGACSAHGRAATAR